MSCARCDALERDLAYVRSIAKCYQETAIARAQQLIAMGNEHMCNLPTAEQLRSLHGTERPEK